MLTTIVQVNPIYVNFSVSEGDMLKLNKQIAATGQVAVPGGKSANGSAGFAVSVKLADGTVRQSRASSISPAKLNPLPAATTPAPDSESDGALRPGQFVRVVLGGASRTQSITVPQRAILDGPMGRWCSRCRLTTSWCRNRWKWKAGQTASGSSQRAQER